METATWLEEWPYVKIFIKEVAKFGFQVVKVESIATLGMDINSREIMIMILLINMCSTKKEIYSINYINGRQLRLLETDLCIDNEQCIHQKAHMEHMLALKELILSMNFLWQIGKVMTVALSRLVLGVMCITHMTQLMKPLRICCSGLLIKCAMRSRTTSYPSTRT